MIRDTPRLRKLLLLVACAWSLLVVGWVFWVFGAFDFIGREDGKEPESKYQLSDLPFEFVQKVVWLDDTTLLLSTIENYTDTKGHIRDVVIYDWNSKETVLSYKDAFGASGFSSKLCITKFGLFLDANLGTGENSNFREMYLLNPLDPDTFTKHDHSFNKDADHYWKINPLDCKPFKVSKNAPKGFHADTGDFIKIDTRTPLRLSLDGLTRTYTDPNDKIIIKGIAPNTNSFDNSSLSIPPLTSNYRHSLVSQWNKTHDAYFLSEKISDLSQNPSSFKSTARLVSKDLKVIREYDIPAGPWIYNLGYRSCFSCGCGCYDRMHLKLSGDSIFALISGKGVQQKHKGVYRLHADQTWEHILRGADTQVFSINESSCLVATGGAAPKITNICSEI